MPLADQITLLLRTITPTVIWLWILLSLGGLVYAVRLWCRARRDVRNQRRQHIDGAFAHVAHGNLRRVQVRVIMFFDFLLIGACAVGLSFLPPEAEVLRETVRLVYVLLLLKVNVLLAINSYKDDRHDLILRVLLQRNERPPHRE